MAAALREGRAGAGAGAGDSKEAGTALTDGTLGLGLVTVSLARSSSTCESLNLHHIEPSSSHTPHQNPPLHNQDLCELDQQDQFC